jgi:hypothetical protein
VTKEPPHPGSDGGQDGYDPRDPRKPDRQDHAERQGQPTRKARRRQLHFGEGVLAGLKLIGFSIWERRGGTGRNVTSPARQCAINGERRSFALLRPIVGTTTQDALRELILEAYVEYEERAAAADA